LITRVRVAHNLVAERVQKSLMPKGVDHSVVLLFSGAKYPLGAKIFDAERR